MKEEIELHSTVKPNSAGKDICRNKQSLKIACLTPERLTFRTGKRHRVQESGKSKNVLKLASKLQYFINTGKSSKRDLKQIDYQIALIISDQGAKISQLLGELKDRTPKVKGRDALEWTCTDWKNWLTRLDSKDVLGYADISAESEARSAILESAVDSDTDMFRMLSAFNVSLTACVRKSSYEVPNSDEIQTSAKEILDAYQTKQRVLAKLRS